EKSSPALRYPQEKSINRLPAALQTKPGRERSKFAVILDEAIFGVDDCNRERAIFYTQEDILSDTSTLEKRERFVLRPLPEDGIARLYGEDSAKVFVHHNTSRSHTATLTEQYAKDLQDSTGITIIKNVETPAK
ncbi:unnamed protein product, partial [Allacma fusca]